MKWYTSVIRIKVLAQYLRLRYDLVSTGVTLTKTCNSVASASFKTRHGSTAVYVTSPRAGKTSNASIRARHWTRCCTDTIRCDTIPFCPHSRLRDISLHEDCCVPGMWRRVFLYTSTNISEELLYQISGQNSLKPRRWRQYVPPKHCYLSIRLHGIIYRKSVILLFATARTTNVTNSQNKRNQFAEQQT
jgi:hypothetical protein